MSASGWWTRTQAALKAAVDAFRGKPPAAAPAAATPAAAPAPPAAAVVVVPAAGERWVAATTELKSAVKWLIAAMAAVATVMFGAGPFLAATKVDLASDPLRIGLFVGGIVVALLGILMVIAGLLAVLLPTALDFNDLSAEFLAKVDAQPGDFLPSGVESVADLREKLAAFAAARPELLRRAEREKDPILKAALVAAAARAASDVTVLRQARTDLVLQGEYLGTLHKVKRHLGLVGVGAVVAALGVSGYLIASVAPTASPADPVVAVLTRVDGAAGDQLWAALALQRCEAGEPGHVPVLVLGGEGTGSSPYEVRTLGGLGECPALAFKVPQNAALVVEVTPRATEQTGG